MRFKVGDTVKVRNWEEMAKQYSLYLNGDINISPTFVKSMKWLCGRVFKITELRGDSYRLENLSWSITDEMLCPNIIKSEQKFKLNDRVIHSRFGTGSIVYSAEKIVVCFDRENPLLSTSENVRERRCLTLDSDTSALQSAAALTELFHIFQNGNTIIMEDVRTCKLSEAKCSRDDIFNEYFGIDLALKRMFDKDSDNTKQKYSVGDRVLIADSLLGVRIAVPDMNRFCGMVMTVKEVLEDIQRPDCEVIHKYKMIEDGGRWVWNSKCIKEKVKGSTPVEASKAGIQAEVDDIVKIISVSYGVNPLYVNQLGKVVNVDGTKLSTKVSFANGIDKWFSVYNYVIVKSAHVAPVQKPITGVAAEVGDTIKLLQSGDSRAPFGETGTVIKVDESSMPTLAKFPLKNWWSEPKDYTIVEKAKKAAQEQKLQKPVTGIIAKAGDKIKIVRLITRHNPIVEVGQEFVIQKVFADGDVGTGSNTFRANEYIIIEKAKQKEKQTGIKAAVGDTVSLSSGTGTVMEVDNTYLNTKVRFENGHVHWVSPTSYSIVEKAPVPESLYHAGVTQVHRSAKVGEYIILIQMTSGCDIGTILKVNKEKSLGNNRCGVNTTTESCICDRYYDVLEGFDPMKLPKKAVFEFKKGDYAIVVKTNASIIPHVKGVADYAVGDVLQAIEDRNQGDRGMRYAKDAPEANMNRVVLATEAARLNTTLNLSKIANKY